MRRAATDTRPGSLSRRLRDRRFAQFEQFADTLPRPLRIIDVGGTPDYWRARGWGDRDDVKITLVNLKSFAQASANIIPVTGDATSLAHDDDSFDLAFSNSVIEHLFTYEDQERMAREVSRVAPAYWVQTPNFWFPVEPHFLAPTWHWMPRRVRVEILTRRDMGWADRSPRRQAELLVEEIRLLRRRELVRLFPDAILLPERVGGLVKSWTATRVNREQPGSPSSGRAGTGHRPAHGTLRGPG